jgi:ribonuclease E
VATTEPAAKKTTRKTASTKAAKSEADDAASTKEPAAKKATKKAATKKTTAKKSTKKVAAKTTDAEAASEVATEPATSGGRRSRAKAKTEPVPPVVLFQAPDPAAAVPDVSGSAPSAGEAGAQPDTEDGAGPEADSATGTGRRRRRRGGRGRGRGKGDEAGASDDTRSATKAGAGSADDSGDTAGDDATAAAEEGEGTSSSSRRRRRRRRRGGSGDEAAEVGGDDPERTVVHVRKPRGGGGGGSSAISGVKGSTRLEAKKQRRREGREQGRRRPPVLTESEFLARREAVDRVMVVRQQGERTQIAVIEDGVLVEHYVARASSASMVGNVFLGKVQNVLPSMEAAFVEVGRGRNAVLYAGEVNWDAAGLDGQPKRIEHALKSGDAVLVQVTKDPIGHKGARLTAQVSLPGRYLVYVPDGSMTGISRKLPDNERSRLKGILKRIVPDDAGVIVRTAAEGASEEELQRDVTRLSAQWEDISVKAKTANAPAELYEEPDLTVRVIRDIFNEDFSKLVVSGDDAWDEVDAYVGHVAPDLAERVSRWTDAQDVFAAHRIDEQLAKALDRKVWLPSGGYLIIDSTEAMVVIDVNTGKFTGQGGNLEETVTKNNVEAAEEIVRQLRLRDVGGIVVIDFIDMVLESNRELVLRRLLECLGRDRTKHQVAEVTSLGLVQMTRKRVGQSLLDAFSTVCDSCGGRGRHIHTEPVEPKRDGSSRDGGKRGGSKSKSGSDRSTRDKAAAKAEKAEQAEKAAKAAQAVKALKSASKGAKPSVDPSDDPAETGQEAAAAADGGSAAPEDAASVQEPEGSSV